MSNKILFEAAVGPGASPFYGVLKIANIRNNDGSALKIENYLAITFKSPVAVNSTDLVIAPHPWVEFAPDVTNDQINASTFQVTGKLSVSQSYTASSLNVDISISGDLTKDPESYLASIVFAVDSIPK